MNSGVKYPGRVCYALLILCCFLFLTPSTSLSQGRVNDYIVEEFDGGLNWDWSNSTYLGWSDNATYNVAMPFEFSYDGHKVAQGSTMRVSTNGWIQFTLPGYSPNAGTTIFNLLGNSTYRNSIAFFASNMYVWNGLYYKVTGTTPNRVMTFYYWGVKYTTLFNLMDMQVNLYEANGQIEYIYSPNNFYLGSTAVNAGVGLNGHILNGFQSRTVYNQIDNTPLRNIRMRPPKPGIPQLALSTKKHDFGESILGVTGPKSMSVTVTNIGINGEPGGAPSTLNFSLAQLQGTSDYTFISAPAQSLAIGESKTYEIEFKPVDMGTRSTSFVIKTNGVDSGSQAVDITGFGLAGRMEIKTDHLFRKTRTKLSQNLEQVVPVTNTGNYPITILGGDLEGEYANQYAISGLPEGPIQPGTTAGVTVRFKPMYEGLRTAELVLESDAFYLPTKLIRLWGTGIVPRLKITPTAVASDSVAVGDTAYYAIRLENVGNDTLAITKNYFSSADKDFFYQGLIGSDSVIAPETFREVTVGFAPQTRGTRQARLRLTTNIPPTFGENSIDTSEFNIDILGVGVPYGILSIEASTEIDSQLIGSKICRTVTIWNNGESPLTINSATISGPDASNFTISGIAFPLTIAPMGNVQVQICATPSSRGMRVASIDVNATSGDKTSTTQMSLAVFGLLACGQPDVAQAFNGEIVRIGAKDTATITVTNCGDVAAVYMATVSGNGYTILGTPNTGAIMPGGTVSYQVQYAPSTMALQPGTLRVMSEGITDIVIDLAGTGGNSVLAAHNTSAQATEVGASSTFDVTVRNTGNMNWNIGTPQVTAGEFTLMNHPSMIAANGEGTFTFEFKPVDGGSRMATVSFGASDNPAFSFAVNGALASVREVASHGYLLEQNYPNPVVSRTTISFTMAEAGRATIVLCDLTGKTVATVTDGYFGEGVNTVKFDARTLPNGTYFYELIVNGVRLQRAMMVSQ